MKTLKSEFTQLEQAALAELIGYNFYMFRKLCLELNVDCFEIMRQLDIEGQYDEEENEAFLSEHSDELFEAKLPTHWDADC